MGNKILLASFIEEAREKKSFEYFLSWLKKQKTNIEFVEPPDFANLMKQVSKDHVAWARFSIAEHADLMSLSGSMELRSERFRVMDTMAFRRGRWECGIIFDEVLRRVIVTQGKNLDLRGSAYVIGTGAALVAGAAAALELGMKEIFLLVPGASEEEDLGEVSGLCEYYVGAHVQTLAVSAITLQSATASLLINTYQLESHQDLAADLAYFNFMQSGGIVVDLSSGEMNLQKEAIEAKLRYVDESIFMAEREILFAEKLGLNLTSSRVEFLGGWLELCGQKS